MFFPGSRYKKAGIYQVTRADGTLVPVTKLPLPVKRQLQGYHQRRSGERLDSLAYSYLKDATAFWKLCEANNTVVPDALATRKLIGIPFEGE